MKQTPLTGQVNYDLLGIIPRDCKRVVEIGCSSGGLAEAYKTINPTCEYIGIEIDADYGELARRFCDKVIVGNIENMSGDTFAEFLPFDIILFGDVLEHLYDPWQLLKKLRANMSPKSQIAACIPNMQHWGIQARLSVGAIEYEESGLLDRTHIRWFTRMTMEKLFAESGFSVEKILTRMIVDEPQRDNFLPHIRAMAMAAGGNPDQAIIEAQIYQYVFVARPA